MGLALALLGIIVAEARKGAPYFPTQTVLSDILILVSQSVILSQFLTCLTIRGGLGSYKFSTKEVKGW